MPSASSTIAGLRLTTGSTSSISGNDMTRVLLLLALLAASASALAAAPGQSAFDVPQLMHRLSLVSRSTAYFSERKELGMLSEPLDSSGTLAYVAPNKLQKSTLQPKPERITVDGDTLTIEQSGERQ